MAAGSPGRAETTRWHATKCAITATRALAELGLLLGEARIVSNSNKLGLRLLPREMAVQVAPRD